jgi:hypothetical protein
MCAERESNEESRDNAEEKEGGKEETALVKAVAILEAIEEVEDEEEEEVEEEEVLEALLADVVAVGLILVGRGKLPRASAIVSDSEREVDFFRLERYPTPLELLVLLVLLCFWSVC